MGIYSITSFEMVSKVPWILKLQPVIPQTHPVHWQLAAGSPRESLPGLEDHVSLKSSTSLDWWVPRVDIQ